LLESSLENFIEHRSDSEKSTAIVQRLLEIKVENFVDISDASRALHLVNMLARSSERSVAAWKWCEPFFEHFGTDAVFVNVYANMAFAAREEEQLADRDPDSVLSFESVEDLFQRSLDLDPERANNFARAGQFYLAADRMGDAERCFARGFRLARDDDRIALQLSEIYAETDRVSDALNVLDMSIRSGCEEPAVFWQAAMTALRIDRYEIVASYLEKYNEMVPAEPWTHYYLAMSYVEQNRTEDALRSLQLEQEASPDSPFGIEVLRAAAFSQKDDTAALAQQIDLVLSIPLSSVDYLTRSGIASLLTRLVTVVEPLGTANEHNQRVTKLVVQAGLAPDELFEVKRITGQKIEDVAFYMCTFEQPLDSEWSKHPGCLYGESSWSSYICRWGVIARSEDEAERLCRAWQEQCYHKPSELLAVDMDGDGYEEQVGVVWMSAHFHPDDFVQSDPLDDEFEEGPESEENEF
jgi:tetratricopeptide (TPR) repeat protein